MRYRPLGATGMRASELALGLEHLVGRDAGLVGRVIGRAMNAGVNYCDAFMAEPNVRDAIGAALAGKRDRMMIQGHFGPVWQGGKEVTLRDLPSVRASFADLMARLRTDYIDVGMVFYVDDGGEWDAFVGGEAMAYIRRLKREGAIRAIGLSCHNPSTALKAATSGEIDVLMFSVNPAFDLLPDIDSIDDVFDPDTYRADGLTGLHPIRAELYRACEARGVGVTAMKSLGGGLLLSAERSPLGRALTPVQLMRYALTRPAVASAVVGVTSEEQVDAALRYFEADGAELDFAAALSEVRQFSARGRCLYCNHCLPCAAGIDIATVNKYLDMAEASEGPADALRGHYAALSRRAEDCAGCGDCETRCPFEVKIRERMARAAEVFGG